jgi:hypothetical protein
MLSLEPIRGNAHLEYSNRGIKSAIEEENRAMAARFVLVQHTKTGKNDQIIAKYTETL